MDILTKTDKAQNVADRLQSEINQVANDDSLKTDAARNKKCEELTGNALVELGMIWFGDISAPWLKADDEFEQANQVIDTLMKA